MAIEIKPAPPCERHRYSYDIDCKGCNAWVEVMSQQMAQADRNARKAKLRLVRNDD